MANAKTNANCTAEQWQTEAAAHAQPGPEHEPLRELAGTWATTTKYWFAPGSPPMESTGSNINTLVFDRYVASEFQSQEFAGRGWIGFDRVTNEYQSAWIDNMGTSITLSRGKMQDGGRRLEMRAEAIDAATRKPVSYRMVTRYLSRDEHVWEMFTQLTGAPEQRVLEITYRRRS
jgi:hypothetical protein